jgi:RNA polymerase sigma-70 factor (ECF subfamily)
MYHRLMGEPEDPAVEAAWRAGTAAFPDVALARERLASHVARHGADAAARHGADLFLACASAHGDPAALRHVDALLVAASHAVRQIDADPAFVDEARQRLRAALLVGDGAAPPRIAAYAGRGPLRAWLGVSAVRTALMMERARKRAKEVPADDPDELGGALAMASTGDPELDLLKRQHAAAFRAALVEACAGLEPRLRACLRMHLVDELSIDEIGAAYGVHRATAARWVQRARDELAATSHRLLIERLRLSATELDRLAALVRSQLDVSLSQLLPAE